MTNREEFADLLYSIYFTNFDTPEYVESRFQKSKTWLKASVPSKLYHYRRCSDYSIDALEKNEIWGSSIIAFNDPFECMPCYHIDQLQSALDAELNEEKLFTIISRMRNNGLPDFLSQMVEPGAVEPLSQMLAVLPDDTVIRAGIFQFKQMLFAYINSNLYRFEKEFFRAILHAEQMFHIACFSESNTSSLMWGHYADSHKGFCLEYDFASVLTDCQKNCPDIRNCPGFMMNYSLAPVIYSPERYNATSGLYTLIMNSIAEKMGMPVQKYYPDMFMPIKNLLTKSADWQYEKEWRLFMPPAEQFEKYCCMTKLKPTAAYLGINMSSENKERIIQICKEQEIPCSQMIPHYLSSAYEIQSVEASLD